MNLLTRDDFRAAVFARDGGKCVLCGNPAQDAHHILERRLWDDGGYYLDNGASVCGDCHIACEKTLISVDRVREAAGIIRRCVPIDLYDDENYDKWGNIITSRGRLPGALYYDSSVQKILIDVKDQFIKYVKYPRTLHLPWSNPSSDDKVLNNLDHFNNCEIVVTEKMDGENTSLYNDYIHARSIDSRNHVSRNWVKNFHSQIAHDIPIDHRVCGENLYAKHTLEYNNLPSYFLGFSVWHRNTCLDWYETLEWFNLLSIIPVKELYRGLFNINILKELTKNNTREGYVIRKTGSFTLQQFQKSVAKFVHSDFKPNTHNWMHQRVEPNGLG